MNTPPVDSQVRILSQLIQLERTARSAGSEAELLFTMANETRQLVAYRQALIFKVGSNHRVRLQAASGVTRPDPNAPFGLGISRIVKARLKASPDAGTARISEESIHEDARPNWREWQLGYGLWCPMVDQDDRIFGGMLLVREKPWGDADVSLLDGLGKSFAHAWNALKRRNTRHRIRALVRANAFRLMVLASAILLAMLPVRLSVLAPVQIIPRTPVVVHAPMAGVIKEILVEPNQAVAAGQPLFNLDDTSVRNEYEVAGKALSVVEAQYMRATQKGFADRKSRADIHTLRANIQMKRAEVDYAAEVLERIRVRAESGGIAVFADAHTLIGKPVALGEKIMTIADANRVSAEIMLPVADAIALAPGAEVRVFLNTRPDRPLAARLTNAAYEAELTPVGGLAFRLKADFPDNGPPPRIGLRGTAKIYGQPVSLFWYIFRKPLTALRLWTGI